MSIPAREPLSLAFIAPFKLGNPAHGTIGGWTNDCLYIQAIGQWEFYGEFIATNTMGEVYVSKKLRLKRFHSELILFALNNWRELPTDTLGVTIRIDVHGRDMRLTFPEA